MVHTFRGGGGYFAALNFCFWKKKPFKNGGIVFPRKSDFRIFLCLEMLFKMCFFLQKMLKSEIPFLCDSVFGGGLFKFLGYFA